MSTSYDTVVKPQPTIDAFDENAVRTRESLPPNAMVIIVDGHPIVHQPPSDVWGLRVIAADTAVEGGRLGLFAVVPLSSQPDPRACDGDVVVLHTDAVTSTDVNVFRNVGVWLAQGGSWALVGTWTGLDAGWPDRIAPTVIRLMQCDASPIDEPLPQPSFNGRFGALRDMVSAGLLHDGEKLLCARPGSGVRYDALVVDGGIQLPDGRWFARPSGALTALGYRHQNGWHYWCRARDGVPLSEIRLAPRQRTALRREPHLLRMVSDGTLHAGDELRFTQPRKGIVHTAQVIADGQIQLGDGRCFLTSSAAIAAACSGSITEGWRTWRRVSDNRTLAELRDEHRSRTVTQQPSDPQTSPSSGQELSSSPR